MKRYWGKQRRESQRRRTNIAVKDIAKQVIDALPDEATMDDIIHGLYVKTKFEHGEREIREGKGVAHEAAMQRLQKWVK